MRTKVRAVSLSLCVTLLLAPPASAQFGVDGDQKVAYFHLTGPILEKPVDRMSMMFAPTEMFSLKDLLGRFKKARDDDQVKAVVLTFEEMSLGLAQMQELRQAIKQVRAADKDVHVHVDQMGNVQYALLSAASDISMVPTGDLWLTGFYAEQPYLKGLLDKIHIEPDILHIGDYKSAGELFTREGPSEPAEANMNWLLDGLYDALVGVIAESRQVSPDKARALIDDGPYSAERALAAGLIDSVKYRQDFVADLKERYSQAKIVKDYGKDTGPEIPGDLFGMFSFFMDLFRGKAAMSTAPTVGVVYVEGMITPGSEKHDPFFGGSSGAKSTTIRKALDKAAKDEAVKAVVLRVDSPGGSALASEIIWNATQRVAAKKPLIVSMGNVAGSGGYYVSCGGHAIFADEATITASIGVVGGKLVTTGMWDWMGVNWKEYKRGNSSAIMSSSHRFNEDERARIQRWMNEVYDVFKGHIEAARGDKLAKPLDEMAGGRVYTGKQALELGLVDRLGGLDDAVKYAAAQAKISDYEIRVIPKPKNFLEMLMEEFAGEEEDEEEIVTGGVRAPLFSADSPLMGEVLPVLQRLDPVRARAVWQALQRLELIHHEGVIAVMPDEIVIR